MYSEETKTRMRIRMSGKNNPMFGRVTDGFTGMHHSESSKTKIREAHIGIKHSEIARKKMSEFWKGKKTETENPLWKGDDVGYKALHSWVKSRLPKPELCEMCKEVPPYDLANKGVYDRDFKNWWWLCRKCHMKSDGRMDKLIDRMTNRRTSKNDTTSVHP